MGADNDDDDDYVDDDNVGVELRLSRVRLAGCVGVRARRISDSKSNRIELRKICKNANNNSEKAPPTHAAHAKNLASSCCCCCCRCCFGCYRQPDLVAKSNEYFRQRLRNALGMALKLKTGRVACFPLTARLSHVRDVNKQ